MTNNKRTAYIAIVLILMFSVVLSACINAAPKQDEGSKETTDDYISVGDAPTSQNALEEKFAVYSHESTEDGKRVLSLFDQAQFDECMQLINASLAGSETKTRPYLTEEEVLFIIDDTIRMYNEYDKIILNRWDELPFVKSSVADDEFAGEFDNGDGLSEALAVQSIEVECYHGDFEEFEYKDAVVSYRNMLLDIYNIISYRFALHDSNFANAYSHEVLFSGLAATGNKFSFGIEDFLWPNPDKYPDGSMPTVEPFIQAHDKLRVLMTDEAEFESVNEYRDYITKLFDYVENDGSDSSKPNNAKIEHSVFVMCAEDTKGEPNNFAAYNRIESDGIRRYSSRHSYSVVFPTDELVAKSPRPRLDASCFEAVEQYQLSMHLPSGQTYYSVADGINYTSQSYHAISLRKILDNIDDYLVYSDCIEPYPHPHKETSFGVCDYFENELYFGVVVGQDTTFYFNPDGKGYIEQAGNREIIYHPFDDIGVSLCLDVLFNRFTGAMLAEMGTVGGDWIGYPAGVAEHVLKIEHDENHINSGNLIYFNFATFGGTDFSACNGYDYADFVKDHGYPLYVCGASDKYFYYSRDYTSMYTFNVDENGNMQNCKEEDGKYFAYVKITGYEGGNPVAVGYGAGVHQTVTKPVGYFPSSEEVRREFLINISDSFVLGELPVGTEMIVAFSLEPKEIELGQRWEISPEGIAITKKVKTTE